MAISQNFPSIAPSLNLNFASSRTLDPRITFTRTSSGTYFGPNGLLQTAPANSPRFDHNPATGESLGLLVEEQRTNLLLRSEEFGDGYWSKSGTAPNNVTISANAGTAPNGTQTADKLIESPSAAGSTDHRVFGFLSPAAGNYTFSVYVKASGRTQVELTSFEASVPSNPFVARFDLPSATVLSTLGLTVPGSASVQALANGWYRCSVTGVFAGTNTAVIIGTMSSGSSTYTGNGVDGLLIWGAQLEAGAFPTSYISTTSSAATRSADVASITGANFSSWYRQDEGTLFAESFAALSTPGAGVLHGVADTPDNTTYVAAGTSNNAVVRSSTVVSAALPAAVSATGISKTAIAYKINDFAAVANGGAVSTDTAGAVTVSPVRYKIGGAPWLTGGGNEICGHIRRLVYWPARLPNSVLQTITR